MKFKYWSQNTPLNIEHRKQMSYIIETVVRLILQRLIGISI